MEFKKALKSMKEGAKVKLPTWGGYWYWDFEKETIMMRTKDGEELDIRDTNVVEYTTMNICSNEWMIADEHNCPQLGGVALFGFDDAIRLMKRGIKVARNGWNGKNQYIVYVDPWNNRFYKVIEKEDMPGTLYPYIAMKTNDNAFVPWLASQTDMLAEDWNIVD